MQDGNHSNEYIINAYKPSTDASLSALPVKDAASPTVFWSHPTFSGNSYKYYFEA